ncbi:hypothetical protein AV530_013737 [Patagioenas fasciata monilis]|uniref:Uncharacterized protein n=1 Tax=Patagioenas fasciata monilis TaxID=372326 RepID=A0A1V4J7R0_PATFA|nr:hypothetical protein AV530_013737 [Patagioenas fasciata monilis]
MLGAAIVARLPRNAGPIGGEGGASPCRPLGAQGTPTTHRVPEAAHVLPGQAVELPASLAFTLLCPQEMAQPHRRDADDKLREIQPWNLGLFKKGESEWSG